MDTVTYIWYCNGFAFQGHRYLFSVLVSYLKLLIFNLLTFWDICIMIQLSHSIYIVQICLFLIFCLENTKNYLYLDDWDSFFIKDNYQVIKYMNIFNICLFSYYPLDCFHQAVASCAWFVQWISENYFPWFNFFL